MTIKISLTEWHLVHKVLIQNKYKVVTFAMDIIGIS